MLNKIEREDLLHLMQSKEFNQKYYFGKEHIKKKKIIEEAYIKSMLGSINIKIKKCSLTLLNSIL